MKIPSTPEDPAQAVLQGLDRLADDGVDLREIGFFFHGTTVATNALLQERGARVVGYVFESDLETCLARNAGRVGRARVSDMAIHITYRKLRWPSYAEGFNALFHVRARPEGGFDVREWREGDESERVRRPDA